VSSATNFAPISTSSSKTSRLNRLAL
jgi:hypothetical protein